MPATSVSEPRLSVTRQFDTTNCNSTQEENDGEPFTPLTRPGEVRVFSPAMREKDPHEAFRPLWNFLRDRAWAWLQESPGREQQTLAQEAGMSSSTVSTLLHGDVPLRSDTVNALLQLFDLTLLEAVRLSEESSAGSEVLRDALAKDELKHGAVSTTVRGAAHRLLEDPEYDSFTRERWLEKLADLRALDAKGMLSVHLATHQVLDRSTRRRPGRRGPAKRAHKT